MKKTFCLLLLPLFSIMIISIPLHEVGHFLAAKYVDHANFLGLSFFNGIALVQVNFAENLNAFSYYAGGIFVAIIFALALAVCWKILPLEIKIGTIICILAHFWYGIYEGLSQQNVEALFYVAVCLGIAVCLGELIYFIFRHEKELAAIKI